MRAPASAPEASREAAPASLASSAFDAQAFESSLAQRSPGRWIASRRSLLVGAALLGCLGVFLLARWLALERQIDAAWVADPGGRLQLQGSPQPALEAHRGRLLLSVGAGTLAPLAVDAALLHRSSRWQPDDLARSRQGHQHEALAARLASGSVRLQFEDGAPIAVTTVARGWAGLGLRFWCLSALALMLALYALAVVLARAPPGSFLVVAMSLCQTASLLLGALESTAGLALPVPALTTNLPLRMTLDLCTGAAVVHAFAIYPRRLAHAAAWAVAAWAVPALWLAQSVVAPWPGPWWSAQIGCLALGVAAMVAIERSLRAEPNPYARVMRSFSWAAVATLALGTAAVAASARIPGLGAAVAASASVVWPVVLAALLLLTPFLTRSRQLLREFAMLAIVSALATALDLLFAAVFALDSFASLALAVFIGLGLYAGVRQWLLGHLVGARSLTTERLFEQLYRAARDLQARPARYPLLLSELLRDLFEPVEMQRVQHAPPRAWVLDSGAALVVPLRHAEEQDLRVVPADAALLLRFAQRGRRLFTREDARLADRVVEQLRRAVAYDQAVERGRHEERVRIAQDLHDDIGARLLTLMYQAPTPEMEDYLRHTLQDLKTLSRGLAAGEHLFSHAAAEWKADLTQRLTAARVGLGWSFQCDRELRLSVVQWSALTRVLRELASNALYHGHAARIDIAIELYGPELTLRVADDGLGRAPQGWSHGLGMGGVRKRVKLLGGEVAWRENEPRGIVCSVRVAAFSGHG